MALTRIDKDQLSPGAVTGTALAPSIVYDSNLTVNGTVTILTEGTAASHVITKSYVDAALGDISAALAAILGA